MYYYIWSREASFIRLKRARINLYTWIYYPLQKCYSFKNCVVIRHFDGSVPSNVRYVTCSHGTDCHAESLAGGVHCFKMAKIDPVSPFYPNLWLKRSFAMRKPTRRRKNEPLGCKYLLLRVSKLEVFTQLPQSYHENSWTSMVSYPGGGGGTRYILGWGGAARPLIPWPCLTL